MVWVGHNPLNYLTISTKCAHISRIRYLSRLIYVVAILGVERNYLSYNLFLVTWNTVAGPGNFLPTKYEDSSRSHPWNTSFRKFCRAWIVKHTKQKNLAKAIISGGSLIWSYIEYEIILFNGSSKLGTGRGSIEHSIITNWSLFKSPNGHVMNLLSVVETWCPVRIWRI